MGDEGGVRLPQQELEGERRRRREILSQGQVFEILVFAGNKINAGERSSNSLAEKRDYGGGNVFSVSPGELENYFHLLLVHCAAASGANAN